MDDKAAWKAERDRKIADGTVFDDIRVWYRAEKDKESREDFDKYSWGKWFEALDLSELRALADAWWRVIQYAEGHELLVMRWNQQQLHRAILVRQGANLMGGDLDQPVAIRKT
jgi:hypothetical protein